MPDVEKVRLTGVCCEFCDKLETDKCPVLSAKNWSRWNAFCQEYVPSKKWLAAKTLEKAAFDQFMEAKK